jgi:beta-lactamase class D
MAKNNTAAALSQQERKPGRDGLSGVSRADKREPFEHHARMNPFSKLIYVYIFLSLAYFQAQAAEPNFQNIFQDKDGCFVLYDLKSDKVVCQYNESRCQREFAPCSTFKIAIALMAFDKGILKDENTTYKWDGVDRGNPYWNRDTSATDWLKYSVVWYSQRITPQLGAPTIEDYLAKFDYGNRDISGGLTNFWLGSTLKISANEEIEFLKKLWRDELPVSPRAMALTKKIMPVEISPSGARLAGKTGSHSTTTNSLGWFVGHLDGKQGEYLVAVNYTEDKPPTGNIRPGMMAEKLCQKILEEMQLY